MGKVDQGYVKTSNEGAVMTVEFYHPSHNSLPGNLLKQLQGALLGVKYDESIKIIVLKSGGARTFCAGASFDELVSINEYDTGKSFFLGFANVINAIRVIPQIVIGRVQGKTVGGGVGLASACDYCMATKYASSRLSELAVGIGPFVIGPAVERKIGLSAFSHMALNADVWQTAEWSREKGLYTEVFESTEEMDERIATFTKDLTAKNPEALRLLKKVFWKGTDDWTQLLEERAEMSGKLVLSPFAKEAISGFLSA